MIFIHHSYLFINTTKIGEFEAKQLFYCMDVLLLIHLICGLLKQS